MKKPLWLFAAAGLAALVALLLFARPRTPVTPAAAIPAPAPVAENVAPKLDALFAALVRNPQVADGAPQPVRLGALPDGALRFLGVERGWRLPSGGSFVAGDPSETARRFLLAHRAAFGLANPRVELTPFRTLANPGFTTVRLQQTYGEIPVLAAQTVVHVSDAGDIRCVLADLATQLAKLDPLPMPFTTAIPAAEAPERAVALVRAEQQRGPLKAEPAQLVVYVPDVLGLPGEPALAWEVHVESTNPRAAVRGRAIVHAGTGALLNYLDEIHAATNRVIYDDANSATTEPVLKADGTGAARVEGGAASGIAEVDNLYAYIGQTDAFYLTNNARNGYNGAGARIYGIARSVPPGQTAPWANASAGGNVMQFGVGYVADDIVAHEYTHLVTEQTSGLLYQNASGAINESLSDIWGEFMDLSNTGQTPNGNDAASVRWEVGEDRAAGPLRSMRDPGDLLRAPGSRRFNDPDRLGSALYVPVAVVPNGAAGGNDNGGVHSNSGVCNKLAYLLTDGDTFNGQTITGEGIANVADLFYQVQTNYLVPASDWRDLYFAITNAAANLEWSAPRQINVNHACSAVEIAGAGHDYYVDRAAPASLPGPIFIPIVEVGIPNTVGILGPYRSIPAGLAAVNDGGTLNLNGASVFYQVYGGGAITLTKPVTLKSYNGPTIILP